MIWIDTEEKMDWFLGALESDNFGVVDRKWTKKERAEVSREIAEYRASNKYSENS